MKVRLRPMTRDDAAEVTAWRYPAPYDFYNADADADDLEELLHPESWLPHSHFAATDSTGALVGFFTFEEGRDGALSIGLGMRPDLTGRGLGLAFVRAGIEEGRTMFRGRPFQLAVAAFNVRAIRVYEKAGFERIGTFLQETNGGVHEFVAMRLREWSSRGPRP